MKYRDLVEGQSEESSIVTLHLLESDDEEYTRIMAFIVEHFDEEIPASRMKAVIHAIKANTDILA